MQLYGSLIVFFVLLKFRQPCPTFKNIETAIFSPTLREDQLARVWKRKRDFFRDVSEVSEARVYHVKVMKNTNDKIHIFCAAIPVISDGTADVPLGVLFNWWDLWLLIPGDAICCERVFF